MDSSPLLSELINTLQHLPGIGPKSAQRIAFQLLEKDRNKARELAHAITAAIDHVGQCERCRTFSENALCALCASTRRHHDTICVVESPLDVASIEQAGSFDGRYFVLMGRLSPIDGVLPEHLGLPALEEQIASGETRELIVATSTTMEGEATAHYLKQIAERHEVKVTRIAHGVPFGGELEFVDHSTLAHALSSRHEF
ncbi:MAG: recombination mediator RecR [Pseudomonadota bacterium]